ncbi:MAG: porphobilinogen synthase [Euryarchaeota archaeon]|nr:porphobilinogen synthase [Euryarchaeota archaeon]|tara:strand:+ start:21106 stop:22080 length:975 start_codon:yes stop_codon:yes gene_type:complete
MKIRPRINRWTAARRKLINSSSIAHSLVQPHFVVDGEGVDVEINSMPGISLQSVDVLVQTIADDMAMGISNHMLFPIVDPSLKDSAATVASHTHMPLHNAVRELKSKFGGDIVIMTDVCLCTATDHGHCGIVHNQALDNDLTLPVLSQIALSHAEAGADYIAASDMMDGRIGAIRDSFEQAGHTDTGILSYSVKYASSFYGPFRDAASSSPSFGDRATHQMDVTSGYSEAIFEATNDVAEGADIIMVKPALAYMDVVREVANAIHRPVAVYNVSGEYSMVMTSAEDESSRKNMVTEIFHGFKRAGADIIVSYHTREAVRLQWFQ